MEYLELFDQDDHPIQQTIRRDELKQAPGYVRVIHAWCRYKDGHFLIQQRNKPDDPSPFQYATTTGIPNVNESPLDATIRELYEELGLNVDVKQCQFIDKILTSEGPYKTITYRYVITLEEHTLPTKLDHHEVKQVDKVPYEQILSMVKKGLFWDYATLLRDKHYFKTLEASL